MTMSVCVPKWKTNPTLPHLRCSNPGRAVPSPYIGVKRTAVGCLSCVRTPQCIRKGRHRQHGQHDALAGPTSGRGGAAQMGINQPGAVRRARRASGRRASGARHARRGEYVGVGWNFIRAFRNVSLIPFGQEGEFPVLNSRGLVKFCECLFWRVSGLSLLFERSTSVVWHDDRYAS